MLKLGRYGILLIIYIIINLSGILFLRIICFCQLHINNQFLTVEAVDIL